MMLNLYLDCQLVLELRQEPRCVDRPVLVSAQNASDGYRPWRPTGALEKKHTERVWN